MLLSKKTNRVNVDVFRIARVFFVLSLVFSFARTLPDVWRVPIILHGDMHGFFVALTFLGATLIFLGTKLDKFDVFVAITIVAYLSWSALCLFLGINRIDFGDDLSTIPSLEKIVNFFDANLSPNIKEVTIKVWLAARSLKGLVFDPLLICVFSSYFLYRNKVREGLSDYRIGLMMLFGLLTIYGSIEVLSTFFKVPDATLFLKSFNIYLYDVAGNHGWWPPLLWNGQLRSLTEEPSMLSITLLFIIPVFWGRTITANGKQYWIYSLFFFTSFLMIFLTKSRTGVVCGLGELLVLLLLGLIFSRSMHRRILLNIAIVIVAFFVALSITSSTLKWTAVSSYFNSNVESVFKKNARSNTARYENLMAHLEVFKDNPVFGVGVGLASPYLNEANIVKNSSNNEVNNAWLSHYDRNKFWSEGFGGMPTLNVYAAILVSSGFLGLLLYIFLPGYSLIKCLRRSNVFFDPDCQMLFTSVMVGLVLFVSNTYGQSLLGFAVGFLLSLIKKFFEPPMSTDKQ